MPSVLPTEDGWAPRTTAPPPSRRGSRLTERLPVNNWTAHALCKDQKGVLAPGKGSVWISPERHPLHIRQAAIDVCARCPVREQCAQEKNPWTIQGGVVPRVARYIDRNPKPRYCVGCGQQIFGQANQRWCTRSCMDKARYRDATEGRVPGVSLLSVLGDGTVAELAARVGASTREVYRWKAGLSIRRDVAERYCRRLGVEFEDVWP